MAAGAKTRVALPRTGLHHQAAQLAFGEPIVHAQFLLLHQDLNIGSWL